MYIQIHIVHLHMYVNEYMYIQTYSMHHLLTNANSHMKVWDLRLVLQEKCK